MAAAAAVATTTATEATEGADLQHDLPMNTIVDTLWLLEPCSRLHWSTLHRVRVVCLRSTGMWQHVAACGSDVAAMWQRCGSDVATRWWYVAVWLILVVCLLSQGWKNGKNDD